MNLIHKVRKGLAALLATSVVAMTLVVSPSAQAASFADVPADAWFAPYVNALTEAGVFKAQDAFRPSDNMNRAEFVKTLVGAAGVSIEGAADAKFSDVSSSDWFAPYVNAAVAKGIINGSDKSATFRPTDNVTRAEAVKIALNAFGIDTAKYSSPKAAFTDTQGHWAEDLVSAAYNLSIVDGQGGSKTTFAPNEPITRSAVAKVATYAVIVAEDAASYVRFDDGSSAFSVFEPSEIVSQVAALVKPAATTETPSTETPSTETPATTTPVTSDGTLEVSLAAGSPAAASVPCNAQSLTFAKYDLTANKDDVAVSGLTLNRSGLGSKDDFSKVWVENAAGLRITSRQTVGSDDVVSLSFNTPLTVKAGDTATVSLVAKLKAFGDTDSDGVKDSNESCSTGRLNAFSVPSASAVVSNAQQVVGDFPLVSATMQTADYTTATVSAAIVTSTPTYQVGELNQEFAQWRLTNDHSTRDVLIKSLSVKNEGTGKVAKDLANLSVVVNGTKISTSAEISGEYVTFGLNNYVLTAGRTESFYIRGDIIGMDSSSSDTIDFTVRYPEDFSAIEATTGFGVSHNLDTVLVAASTSDYTIQGGDTTFVKSSTAPASQTKPKAAKDVVFLESNLIVKQDFTTDALKVKLYSNADAGATTLTAADLKNLKLYVDNTLVQTKSGDSSDFTSAAADNATFGAGGSNYVLNYDSTVTLKKGTRVVKLVGDLETNAVSGHKYRAEIAGSTAFTSAKYLDNDRTISTVAGTVTGGDVTIGSSNLTITENSGYAASQTFVAGAQNLSIAKYTLKANDSDDIKVTRLKFTLNNAGVSGADIPAAMVYIDGKQVGSTKSFSTGVAGSVDFTDVNFMVKSNQQVVVELKANLTNSASGNLRVSFAQIDAKDTSSTDATINTAVTTAPAVNSVNLSIATAGTLSINNNSNTPTSAILVASSTEQEIAKFTLAAQNDDIKVTNIYFKTLASIAARVNTISLYDNAGVKVGTGVVNTTAAGEYVYFDMGDSSTLIVPKNNNSYTVTVKATFNSITQASQTGATVGLEVNGRPTDYVSGTDDDSAIRALSTGNNTVLPDANNTETGTVASNSMMLTKTALTFASVEDSSLVSTTTKLANNSAMKAYAFSVSADSAGDAELKSFALELTASATNRVTDIRVYAKDNTSNVLYDSADAGTYANATNKITFTNAERISAGTTKTYIVELTTANVGATESLSIRVKDGAADTAFSTSATATAQTVWSDLSSTSHTTPADGADWFSGYKVKGLSSMSSRSYSNN